MTWFQSSDRALPLWPCDHTIGILPKTRSYFVHLTTTAKIQVEFTIVMICEHNGQSPLWLYVKDLLVLSWLIIPTHY